MIETNIYVISFSKSGDKNLLAASMKALCNRNVISGSGRFLKFNNDDLGNNNKKTLKYFVKI